MSWRSVFNPYPPPPPAQRAMVKGVTLGSHVRLHPEVYGGVATDGLFGLDRDTLHITAQGVIMLEDGVHIHRFYTDDEVMLQAMSNSAQGWDADDFTLFHGHGSRIPAGEHERQSFYQNMRQPSFLLEGRSYQRFWNEWGMAEQEPLRMWEAVMEPGLPVRQVAQACMLYSRPTNGDRDELLLVLETEPQGGPTSHEVMVGIPLSPDEFSV
jgi:hypothetical protein